LPKWSQVPWGIVVPGLLGLYGSVPSAFNFAAQRARDRRRVKIRTTYGVGAIAGQRGPFLVVKVSNIGHRPVHLNSIDFVLPNGLALLLPEEIMRCDPPFPCKLEEGQGTRAAVNVYKMAEELHEVGCREEVRLIARANDAIGNECRRRFKFDGQRWRVNHLVGHRDRSGWCATARWLLAAPTTR